MKANRQNRVVVYGMHMRKAGDQHTELSGKIAVLPPAGGGKKAALRHIEEFIESVLMRINIVRPVALRDVLRGVPKPEELKPIAVKLKSLVTRCLQRRRNLRHPVRFHRSIPLSHRDDIII